MSAQFVDALNGYMLFLEHRGRISLDELNRNLKQRNLHPVSIRTFGHFQKLLDHGFRSYIPINQFDVFQSLGRIQLAADRRRYKRHQVKIAGYISKDGAKWIEINIHDWSLVGFGGKVGERFPIRPMSRLLLSIEGYKPIPVIVAWRRHGKDGTCLGLRALEFVDNYRLEELAPSERQTGYVYISRVDDSDLSWENFFRVLTKIDELLGATHDMLLAINEVVDADLKIASPSIRSIRFGSPGKAEIKVDLGVAETLDVVLTKVQRWGMEKRRYSAETDQIELQNINLKIEAIRKALQLKKELQAEGITFNIIAGLLGPPLQEALGIDELPEGIFDDDSPETAILYERILPASVELVAGDDLSFDIEIDEEG
jgi:hypothetical protein